MRRFILKYGYILYLTPLAVLLLTQQAGVHYSAENLAAWLPLVFVFGVMPAADALIGESFVGNGQIQFDPNEIWFRLVLLAAIPAQTFSVFWATSVFANTDYSLLGTVGWVLSVGIVSAMIAIAPGHELFHKSGRLESWAGGYLFSTVGYGSGKVSHCRDHHVHVGTELDAATAKKGQSVYAFLPRAYLVNYKTAFLLEKQRLNAMGKPAIHPQNEVLWWWAITVVFAGICFYFWGLRGLGFYIAQSVVAFTVLEIINYIEHYGLVRRKLPNGKYEPITAAHSWNCRFIFSNMLLVNLQRHSDHHDYPTKRYQMLVDSPDSPELPTGYPGMVLIAIIPPLWRKVVHPLLEKVESGVVTEAIGRA